MGIGGHCLTLCRSGHTLELTDVSVTHCIVIFRRAITVCVLEMESVVGSLRLHFFTASHRLPSSRRSRPSSGPAAAVTVTHTRSATLAQRRGCIGLSERS